MTREDEWGKPSDYHLVEGDLPEFDCIICGNRDHESREAMTNSQGLWIHLDCAKAWNARYGNQKRKKRK